MTLEGDIIVQTITTRISLTEPIIAKNKKEHVHSDFSSSLHIHFSLDLNVLSAAVCMTPQETQTSLFESTRGDSGDREI